MKRIVISGYYGLGNLGDEAVLAGILASFRALDSSAVITVQSADPAATTALHRVDAVPRYSPRAVFRTIRQADLLLSGGGSLLQDVTSARSAAYYLAIILLAELCRTPVMLYAQGVGPIKRRVTAMQARLLLNHVRMASVRDQGSADLLRRLGMTRPPIHVTADPSFALDPAGDEECTRILSEAGVPTTKPLLGVAVRPWPVGGNWREDIANGISEAARRIGAVPLFLPMQGSSDIPLAEDIAALANVECHVLRGPLTPTQAKGIVGQMAVVIGMRLHALMFAASQAVPSVAISYDPKVASFAGASPAHLPVLDAGAVSPQDLADSVETVWANRNAIGSALRLKQAEWRAEALRNCTLALELMDG
jgi:polysaccharide pyruvyl transferase CsaB